MYYPCSENKGPDQLRGYREADLHLCFRICKKPVSHDEAQIHFLSVLMVEINPKKDTIFPITLNVLSLTHGSLFCSFENQMVPQSTEKSGKYKHLI